MGNPRLNKIMLPERYAEQQSPTVSITNASVDVGDSTTVDAVLSSAPDGLAGYEIKARIENGDLANIVDASYPASVLKQGPKISMDGTTVRVKAADVEDNIAPGAADIGLASIEVEGLEQGETEVTPRIVQIDDDGGKRINPRVSSGTLSVGPMTPTRTATPARNYNLRAGETLAVDIGLDELLVITDIPGTDSNRHAVTTKNYELVNLDLTLDALISETWARRTYRLTDWDEKIREAKELQRKSGVSEQAFRGLDLAVSLEEAAAVLFLPGGPALALSPALDAMTDIINWSHDELNDPFRENLTKMTASIHNATKMNELVEDTYSHANFGEDLQALIEATLTGADFLRSGAGLGKAWAEMVSALKGSSKVSASTAVQTGWSPFKGLFLGFAIDTITGKLDNGLDAQAKISAATHAHATLGIPLFKNLKKMEQKAKAAALSPAQIGRYQWFRMIDWQLDTFLLLMRSKFYESMSNQFTGALWDIIANSNQMAERQTAVAQETQRAAKLMWLQFGEGYKLAKTKRKRSINAEIIED